MMMKTMMRRMSSLSTVQVVLTAVLLVLLLLLCDAEYVAQTVQKEGDEQQQQQQPPEQPRRHGRLQQRQPISSSSSVRKLAASRAPRVLNVHVVPHTHDDVGWRKTVEQYYYGLNTTIDWRGSVHSILSTAVQALTENAARTFTYAEVKFFSMWWQEQNDAVRDTVRYLIANEQWTFVNGGWCMHDEAAAHFMGMMDQTTLGHQFLWNELGVVPVTGWQLDPFGHSATQASLLTYAAGMDALYFGRIDYQDLQRRKETAACEGLWSTGSTKTTASIPARPVPNEDDTIFFGLTGSYGGNYGPPAGFCFDVLCDDELLVGANSTRLLERVTDLLTHAILMQSNQTRGNHIMLTMGEDFTFKEAHVDYSNLDLLIGATMNYQQWNLIDIPSIFGPRFDRVNIFYSNPDYYTEQKYMESSSSSSSAAAAASSKTAPTASKATAPDKIEWPVKTDDFFPYSDCPHCFWTGYFTSRAAFKRFERVASSFLLAARQIDALWLTTTTTTTTTSFLSKGEMEDGVRSKSNSNPLFALEDALGIAQHHDAISGTAKQHVANDYSKKLSDGMSVASLHVIQTLKRLMLLPGDPSEALDSKPLPLDNLSYCPLMNETVCQVSVDATAANDTTVYVIVYNPIAQNRSSVIRLPVASDASFRIERVEEGKRVQFIRSMPTDSLHASSTDVNHELTFSTGVLPPMGAVAFRIVKEPPNRTASDGAGNPIVSLPIETSTVRTRLLGRGSQESVELSNGIVSAAFDITTGMLTGMSAGGVVLALNQTWGYYTSYDSTLDTSDSSQNSGAYIFRPSTPDQKMLPLTPKLNAAKFVPTSVGMEVHASFQEPWMKQVTRIVTGEPYIEVEYTVGPIPICDGRGKEIVARLSAPINSDGVFYTDSNGREFQKRKRDFRPSWDLEAFEPVAGNYYPVNAAIYVEDSEAALSVLVDRSQGGASLVDGSIDLMVQRRTVADDHRGVDEALNETCGGMTPYPPFGNSERVGDGVVIRGKHRILIGKGPVGASLARSSMDGTFAEPLVFVGSWPASDPVMFQKATLSGLRAALAENLMIVTFMRMPDRNENTFLIRLGHQYAPGEDELLSNPVDVDLSMLFAGYNVTSVLEKTLTGNQDWGDRLARRKDWIGISNLKPASVSSRQMTITIAPMEVRTFEIEALPMP